MRTVTVVALVIDVVVVVVVVIVIFDRREESPSRRGEEDFTSYSHIDGEASALDNGALTEAVRRSPVFT